MPKLLLLFRTMSKLQFLVQQVVSASRWRCYWNIRPWLVSFHCMILHHSLQVGSIFADF